MPVTTSPAALKARSTMRGIEAPPEVGRRPVFPGCKARRRIAAPQETSASVFEA
jgi:hypothetical protein